MHYDQCQYGHVWLYISSNWTRVNMNRVATKFVQLKSGIMDTRIYKFVDCDSCEYGLVSSYISYSRTCVNIGYM